MIVVGKQNCAQIELKSLGVDPGDQRFLLGNEETFEFRLQFHGTHLFKKNEIAKLGKRNWSKRWAKSP
jgi:hypothetical protein